MNEIKASLAFGACLAVVGILFARWHLRAWRSHRQDPHYDARMRSHYRAQFRRRIQVSVLLILLGLLIPLGDALLTNQKNPRLFAYFCLAVLLVALWIMALAALDWLSTRMHERATRATLASLARKQRELEAEADRLRGERGNGRN